MINEDFKQKVLAALVDARQNFGGSDAKFATSIGISPAIYSRIKNGETERVMSEANWITIARHIGVSPTTKRDWKTANTPVFQFINAQLDVCQREGLSSLLCDLSDIGKSFAAQHYAKTHQNVAYVDCSQVKSRTKLIRAIAKCFGLSFTGMYSEIYENLVYYLKTLENPIIILDEAGDLEYDAFLEIKALWNATEHCCGYYMVGADGLEAKMTRSIDHHKVGYTELFSRFGKRYGKVVPAGNESNPMLQATAMQIIKANAQPGSDVAKIYRNTLGDDGRPSLRRIYNELAKVI